MGKPYHGHTFANAEEQAYLLGYFAHLVTDVLYQDFAILENNYVAAHPHCSYAHILRKTAFFPDYLGIFPEGAIGRKIKIMAYEVTNLLDETELIFFSIEEYRTFLQQAEDTLFALLYEAPVG